MEKHIYTIEEMKQMMADLIISQQETDKKFQKLEEDFKEISKMFKETDKAFQKTDEKFQKTDEKFQKTDVKIQQSFQKSAKTEKYLDKMFKEIGGIGNSNGAFAEEFFYNGFLENMQINGIKYDYIEPNKAREKGNLKGEYDIVMFNSNKIMVIEVKYKLEKDEVRDFYMKKLPKFKKLFPEYKEYSVCGAISALSFEKGTRTLAETKGLLLFTQSGKEIKRISPKDLKLSEF